MKKSILIFFIASFCGCLNKQPALITGYEGKPLPSFNLLLTDSTTVLNTNKIPTGKPFVILYFSPYCPFCRAETEDIIKNIKSLNETKLYLLSSFPLPNIKDYCEFYKLKNYSNIIVGQDKKNFFGAYYKAPGIPYIAIYNSNKQLKQVLIGKVDIDLIKESLN